MIPENPIEVLAFDSNTDLNFHNLSGEMAYLGDLAITQELETTDLSIGSEIEPHGFKRVVKNNEHDVHTIPGLAKTWKSNWEKTLKTYGSECVRFTYFSPNDNRLAMIKDYHAKRGKPIAIGEASGVLHFRIADQPKSESISLAVVTMVKTGCGAAPRPPVALDLSNTSNSTVSGSYFFNGTIKGTGASGLQVDNTVVVNQDKAKQ